MARRSWMLAAAVGAGAAAVGLGLYLTREAPPPPAAEVEEGSVPSPPPAPPAAPASEAAPPPLDLPPLGTSDPLVRDLAAALSAAPGFAAWLATDDLVRTFVVVVDNLAEGRNPAPHLLFLRPADRFRAVHEAETTRAAAASFSRYDGVAALAASIDVEGAAALYRRLLPLMEAAYAELGQPGGAFEATVRRAAVHLLETPVIEGSAALVRRGPLYLYDDGAIEALSPAQRQFMGMGADNQRRVQQVIRDLGTAIGFADLPRDPVVIER